MKILTKLTFMKNTFYPFFTLLILCITCTITVSGQSHSDRPNFIIVVSDDQGYGDAGYNGNEEIITPNMDALANSGFRLDRYYSAPVCSPTRASILTGRYPTRTGVFKWGHALRPQEHTIANILKDNGYRTGFFGKWHLGSLREDQPTNPEAHGFETWYAAANFYENDPWMSHNGHPVQLSGESSDVTVELALEFIEEIYQNETPFLVFVWLGSPHLPHEAEDFLKNLYPDQPENMKNYYGEITGIDLALGKLRNRLNKLGISENTLLWYSSDNGGKLPEANNGILSDQKGTLYEGGIRIPSLLEWPGMIATGNSKVPAGTVDVFPTLLDFANIDMDIDYPIDGISLAPLLRGEMKARNSPLGFWDYSEIKGHSMRSDQIIQNYKKYLDGEADESVINDALLNTPDQNYIGLEKYPYSGGFAWIEEDWKLHQKGNSFELYNLAEDPGEKNNLISNYPEKSKSMKSNLRKWQESVIRSIKGYDY